MTMGSRVEYKNVWMRGGETISKDLKERETLEERRRQDRRLTVKPIQYKV